MFSQPRLPAASVPGTGCAFVNVRPPSADDAWTSRVPFAPFVVHTTVIAASRSATRGGCSPLTRASPSTSFTRAGTAKVRPPSRLTAAKTSAAPPFGCVALHATTRVLPAAAIDGVAFDRPGIARVTVDDPASIAVRLKPDTTDTSATKITVDL